jgi:hypothetical protein
LAWWAASAEIMAACRKLAMITGCIAFSSELRCDRANAIARSSDSAGVVAQGCHPSPAVAEARCGVAQVESGREQLAGGVMPQPLDLAIKAVDGRMGLALHRASRAAAVVASVITRFRFATPRIVLNPAKLGGWHRP